MNLFFINTYIEYSMAVMYALHTSSSHLIRLVEHLTITIFLLFCFLILFESMALNWFYFVIIFFKLHNI